MRKILRSLLIYFIVLCSISCSNSSTEESCDLEQYALALNNLMEVRATYISNSTTENCNNYRFALQSYINAGENCEQYTSFVEARQNELNNLNCN